MKSENYSPDNGGNTENIHVVVRVRPFLSWEEPRSCVMVSGSQVLVGEDRQFAFDSVFDTDATSEMISNSVGDPFAKTFVNGYTTSMIAYGQTGAGKTYTMDSLSHSIVRRVFTLLRDDSEKNGEIESPSFLFSAVEVYNEQISDLAAISSGVSSSAPLLLREDARGGVYIQGLTEVAVTDEKDLLSWIERSTANRRTASTMMNATSSRSHCLLTVTLSRNGLISRLGFVDLAGSERIKKAYGRRFTTGGALVAPLASLPLGVPEEEEDVACPQAAGNATAHNTVAKRMQEGIHINSGLLALSNVIVALCDQRPHVPYRSSKLTRLLQPMLSGNSKTVIIACISPDVSSFDETLNTLKYADRAKSIRTTSFQVTTSPKSSADAERMIAWLRAQLEEAQRQLQNQQGKEAPYVFPDPAPTSAHSHSHTRSPSHSPSRSRSRSRAAARSTAAATNRVAELEDLLRKERLLTQRLQEDLFNAEYAAMVEFERCKAFEERVAALESCTPQRRRRSPSHSRAAEPAAHTPESRSLLAQLEAERDELQALKTRTEADSALLVAAAGEDLSGRIDAKEQLIRQLTQQYEEAARALDDSQRRLDSVQDEKARLGEELARAEARLEVTAMERDRKDAERRQLRAQFQQRLRRAEDEAAESRRRVQEAALLVTERQTNGERIRQLQGQVADMSDELNRQRHAMREEQQRVQRMAASHAQKVSQMERQRREAESQLARLHVQLQRKEREIARVKGGHPPRSQSTTPIVQSNQNTQNTQSTANEVQQKITIELMALAGIEKDLDELNAERSELRESLTKTMMQTGDLPKWQKATKGFSMRLERIELDLNNEADPAARQRLTDEREKIREKLQVLHGLKPIFAHAEQQLVELDGSIDSLQEARKYHLRRVRQLQRSGAARAADGTPRASELLRQPARIGRRH